MGTQPQKRRFFSYTIVRDLDAGDYFEVFLVSAVASVLAIRFYLEITGYPQLGSGEFHIAHMLWGGFFMLTAQILLLAYFNRAFKYIAAILGGIGFGAFIDELGKFITRDNNYFFQPTAAILYVIFILLFFLFRVIDNTSKVSKIEYLINAMEAVKEVALQDLNVQEKERALDYLRKSDTSDDLSHTLTKLLSEAQTLPGSHGHWYTLLKQQLATLYVKLITRTYFAHLAILFFILQSMFMLGRAVTMLVYNSFSRFFDPLHPLMPNSFAKQGELIFSLIAATFVVAGVLRFNNSRLAAYILFKRSILISIFLTQFFTFYRDQFSAVSGLGAYIVILLTLNYAILQEKTLRQATIKEVDTA